MFDFLMSLIRARGFWVLPASLVIVFSIYLVSFRWKPETQIRMKQSAILVAVENGSQRKLGQMVSGHYADTWKFTKADVIAAFRELRQPFLSVNLQANDEQIVISGDDATVTVHISMNGSGPSPLAAVIVNEANRLKTPFVFTWKKEGGPPWSWKLIRVENAGLPDLQGYLPGESGSFLDAL